MTYEAPKPLKPDEVSSLLDKTIITMAEFAAAVSSPGDPWTARTARVWLRRGGAAVKRGNRWITTRGLLRDHFPELWEKLRMALPQRAHATQSG